MSASSLSYQTDNKPFTWHPSSADLAFMCWYRQSSPHMVVVGMVGSSVATKSAILTSTSQEFLGPPWTLGLFGVCMSFKPMWLTRVWVWVEDGDVPDDPDGGGVAQLGAGVQAASPAHPLDLLGWHGHPVNGDSDHSLDGENIHCQRDMEVMYLPCQILMVWGLCLLCTRS